MDRSSDKVGLLHETFQIGIQFVVFATNHVSKDNPSFQYKDCLFFKYFLNNLLQQYMYKVYLFISSCIKIVQFDSGIAKHFWMIGYS